MSERDFFLKNVSYLSANLRRAAQDMEEAIMQIAQKKWDRDKSDHDCKFIGSVTEYDHHDALRLAIDAFVTKINDAITDSQAFK